LSLFCYEVAIPDEGSARCQYITSTFDISANAVSPVANNPVIWPPSILSNLK
jgi:hypothetical protein